MREEDTVTQQFENERQRLRSTAYRMLGSLAEADDAVQETWLKLNHADSAAIRNLSAWLTTALSRVCLNLLRARRSRREEPLELHMPDPIVGGSHAHDPEAQLLWGDAVGMALMVVMDSLGPAERVAFVLHDMFAVPFDEIAPLLEKSADATRQLASRARRRVRESTPEPETDAAKQRVAVDAFFAASRDGDLDALVSVLDPDVVLRSDGGVRRPQQTVVLQGASTVAGQAVMFRELAPYVRAASINGSEGALIVVDDRVVSVMAFTVSNGLVVAIDVLADPERLRDVAAVS